MLNNKKISIIIPVYNGEKFLNRCLDSIIKQTYSDFEIIIVNDGSIDKTQNIIEEYSKKDSRIVIINKENSGVSDSRNIGIEKATGDYVTFVDADDWLEINTLEKINELLEKQYEVVRYNYFKNYSNNSQKINKYDIKISDKKLNNSEIIEQILPKILNGEIPAYVWLLVIKKNIIDKVEKFNTNLAMMEDTIFYINLITHIDNMYISNEPLYHYYYDLSSASHSYKNAMRNLYNVLTVNQIEREILYQNNFDIEKNIFIFNTAHAKIIEDISFIIFKNYSRLEAKEKISEICNNLIVQDILKNANIKSLPIHIKIGTNLIKKKNIQLLLIYYKIRKLLYYLKNYFTKRIIN